MSRAKTILKIENTLPLTHCTNDFAVKNQIKLLEHRQYALSYHFPHAFAFEICAQPNAACQYAFARIKCMRVHFNSRHCCTPHHPLSCCTPLNSFVNNWSYPCERANLYMEWKCVLGWGRLTSSSSSSDEWENWCCCCLLLCVFRRENNC